MGEAPASQGGLGAFDNRHALLEGVSAAASGSVCTVRDVEWGGKTALVRVDFNVPMEDDGKTIADDTRIRAVLPTIRHLVERGARVILLSHFGRPKGGPDPRYSLEPVAERLGELMQAPCPFAADCIGPPAAAAAQMLRPGDVLLLENVRFHAEEEQNDPRFAAQLAKLGDVFVNDAFGAAHRAHASTAGIAEHLDAVAGLLMEKELRALGSALDDPRRPFVAVVGGAKVSSKLGVLENLLGKVDALLVGGGMANTFLKARGLEVGRSLLEEDLVPTARDLVARAAQRKVKLLLPEDVVVTTSLDEASAEPRTGPASGVRADELIADIGPATIRQYAAEIKTAGTVLWNGPMGVFEKPMFAVGTLAVAKAMADCAGVTVVGGGESVQAVEEAGVADRLTHVSTGGGASLELIEGKTLPGVAALRKGC